VRRLSRSLKIAYTFIRYRLDTFFDDLPLPWYLRLLTYLMVWRYFIKVEQPRGERLRLALESLGPVFIKFGQMLSTRLYLRDEINQHSDQSIHRVDLLDRILQRRQFCRLTVIQLQRFDQLL
jgi:hypothetical protein